MGMAARILVIDDDDDVLTAARLLLKPHFGHVVTASAPERIESLMDDTAVDVFLLDMNFAIGKNSGAEGLKWLQRILERDPDAVVVLMTAFGDLNTAVRAMREGAADFVLKPWNNDKLVATLTVAASLRQSRVTVRALSAPQPARAMVAASSAMRKVIGIIERVAPTDVSVLVRGENGTGKELVAQSLHRLSTRADKALVAVDLGAVSESLFESELFGHRKGAFTGADSDRPGRFQAANGGTLFLDEIGNLPPRLQTKLLRALESREIVPLGSDQPSAVDVRLIAASNQDLEGRIRDGRFREDLLYRLNTIEIVVPPLRERMSDLPPLVAHFLELHGRRHGRTDCRITDAAMRALARHHWPGNVRELSHTIQRAMILGESEVLDADAFSFAPAHADAEQEDLNLDANERRIVKRALERNSGNITHAAEDLGITRAALYRRIEKFGL